MTVAQEPDLPADRGIAGPIWVIVPALNEAENLRDLLPRIADRLQTLDPRGVILVVDDGSTDATVAALTILAGQSPQIRYLQHTRNLGKAAALKNGFSEALSHGAGIIVMMDADGQDDPDELPRLIAALGDGADLVTGARLKRQDRFVKKHTSRLYNRTTGALSGVEGKDFNSGFKAMRAPVAEALLPMLYGELHRYITVIAAWLGFRTQEIEVQHHERMHGSSKYGMNRFWRGFMDLLTVRFLMSYEHRPSHLFGGLGLVSFVVGGLIMVYLIITQLRGEAIGDRPLLITGMILILVGLQLLLFGLLAELIVYTRNRGPEEFVRAGPPQGETMGRDVVTGPSQSIGA